MTTILCWSVKGGSGATVVAAVLGVLSSERAPTVLVDLAGDLPAALGVPEPLGPGVGDWLAAEPTPAPGSLIALAQRVTDDLRLVGRGTRPERPAADDAWSRFASELAACPGTVVVDAGLGRPPDPLVDRATASLLVARPCFLNLRRAALLPPDSATGIVVVDEPGRALCAEDLARTIGVPVVAEVPHDPALARAVDAGLLLGRIPSTISRSLRRAA